MSSARKNHPLIASLLELAPSLKDLMTPEIGITITDRDTQLLYLPGQAGKLEITPGDPLLPDSVSMTSMLENRFVMKKMDHRLGHDYVGRAVPIKDKDGHIIGSLGTVEVVTHELALNTMVVGKSPAFVKAYEHALRAARYNVSVLILGETGTGKELLARLIVQESERRDRTFISVNCASIPPSLFESEMFGYEPGSFTGAQKGGKRGYFELAQNGTIFLDEVGDLDLGLQAKLLRALDTGKITRIGGSREISAHTRIIAATNKDLRNEVRTGKFRPDLFFRLSSIIVTLPPLRDRREDIDLYIDKIFETEKRALNRPNIVLSPEARRRLRDYDYPGNVRELGSILRRAIIFCERGVILGEDLSDQLFFDTKPETSRGDNHEFGHNYSRDARLSAIEIKAIIEVLAAAPSKSEAAKALGISRDTLYRKIKRYSLDKPRIVRATQA